jgi:hypothetical protein
MELTPQYAGVSELGVITEMRGNYTTVLYEFLGHDTPNRFPT